MTLAFVKRPSRHCRCVGVSTIWSLDVHGRQELGEISCNWIFPWRTNGGLNACSVWFSRVAGCVVVEILALSWFQFMVGSYTSWVLLLSHSSAVGFEEKTTRSKMRS